MVDKVEGLIRHLRQYLIYLRQLVSLSSAEFLADPPHHRQCSILPDSSY